MTNYGRNIWRVLWPLLLHTAISFAAAMMIGSIKGVYGVSGMSGSSLERTDATLVTVLTAVVSFPVFLSMWKKDRECFPFPGETKKQPFWFYFLAFLGGIAASCISSILMESIGLKNMFSNQVQEELFAAGSLLQIVGLGFVIPVLEELLYRGVMYHRLREFLDVKPAVVTAALIFALAHGNVIQFLYALPMALILHWLQEKDGKLLAPIAFHMGANLISVIANALKIF